MGRGAGKGVGFGRATRFQGNTESAPLAAAKARDTTRMSDALHGGAGMSARSFHGGVAGQGRGNKQDTIGREGEAAMSRRDESDRHGVKTPSLRSGRGLGLGVGSTRGREGGLSPSVDGGGSSERANRAPSRLAGLLLGRARGVAGTGTGTGTGRRSGSGDGRTSNLHSALDS